ncbi:hypothetical protein ES703_70374 [subsurface metagenome]
MAIEKVYLSEGVPQVTFDAHTHNYRKLTQFGVDANKTYAGPKRIDILDDQEVFGQDGTDIEAVGMTVTTSPTSTPV